MTGRLGCARNYDSVKHQPATLVIKIVLLMPFHKDIRWNQRNWSLSVERGKAMLEGRECSVVRGQHHPAYGSFLQKGTDCLHCVGAMRTILEDGRKASDPCAVATERIRSFDGLAKIELLLNPLRRSHPETRQILLAHL